MSHPFRIAVQTNHYADPFFLSREMYGAGWFSKAFKKVGKAATKVGKAAKKAYKAADKVGKKIYRDVTKPVINKVLKPVVMNTLRPALDNMNPIDYIPGGEFAKDMVRKTYNITLAPTVKKASNKILGDEATYRLENLGKKALDGASATTLLSDAVGKDVSSDLGLSEVVKGKGLKRSSLRANRGRRMTRRVQYA